MREAAVLVPVFRDGADLRIVLIRRVERGVHGGQLAFPGGRVEPGDEDALAAAVREAHEEIGLASDRVTVLEPLPIAETTTTGYRVAPFLASVRRPPTWVPDPTEVAEVLEISVRELARPEARGSALVDFSDWPAPRRVPCFFVGPHRLWGLTFRILEPLLPRLVRGEWPS